MSNRQMTIWRRHTTCLIVATFVYVVVVCLSNRSSGKNVGRRRLTASWSDPKTTVGKFDSGSANKQLIESLRIVAFGTSKTWGAGLKDPEHEAYSKLLSPNALNLGLRATRADYPSLCLHSMIGDQVFDVIILEFSPYSGPLASYFDRLARRIRARFPAAVIIYLPVYMLLNDVVYQKKSLQNYIMSVGVQSPKGLAFVPTIRNLPDSDLSFPSSAYSINSYVETVKDIGGYMIEFPSFHNDIKSFVIDNAKHYTSDHRPWDFVHPSASGHQVIAQKIRHKLSEIYAKRPPSKTDSIGTWLGGKDRCISWFSGGNVTDSIRGITEMELVNFTPEKGDGKWALEVNRNGGSLSVDCLFPNCNIYISYMAKGPSTDYPRVLVSVDGNDPQLVEPYLGNFHLRQIALAGTARLPGVVSVSVKPIPEDVNSLYRFRITGIITTPSTN